MIIIGAGLSGLIAAVLNPQAEVYEASSKENQSHRALLRFRTAAVGDAVGIPFRKIKVHKGIWDGDKFVQPNIQLANLYSKKVTNGLHDRSIWKTESVERYIAPEDFILQLIDQVHDRVYWNASVSKLDNSKQTIISTIPMNKMLQLVPFKSIEKEHFSFQPITVRRFRVFNSDVFQTVYYPNPEVCTYRASITGNLLIVESVNDSDYENFSLREVLKPFGLYEDDVVELDKVNQSYGKIAPIDEDFRRAYVEYLSSQFQIYSLGRFATWRNILLDDVLQDLNVIKRLIVSDSYTRKLEKLK